ncbi:MAG: hypothetical protein ACHQ4F_12995 [Candidatus Dormibacteria bacterium]
MIPSWDFPGRYSVQQPEIIGAGFYLFLGAALPVVVASTVMLVAATLPQAPAARSAVRARLS